MNAPPTTPRNPHPTMLVILHSRSVARSTRSRSVFGFMPTPSSSRRAARSCPQRWGDAELPQVQGEVAQLDVGRPAAVLAGLRYAVRGMPDRDGQPPAGWHLQLAE